MASALAADVWKFVSAPNSVLGSSGRVRFFPLLLFFASQLVLARHFLCSFSPLDHRWLLVAAVAPTASLFVLKLTDPGVITPRNLPHFAAVYRLAGAPLSPQGVPRSKYCRRCHHQIARYDHFCPYFRHPIGGRNLRFFLLTLATCLAASFYLLALALSAPPSPIIFLLFLIIAFVVRLLVKESVLISRNMTMMEEALGGRSPRAWPYNRGILWNWLEVFFPF